MIVQLQSAHERKDHHDNQHQPQTAAWIVSPAGAVRPGRERAEQQQNHDYKNDGSHVRSLSRTSGSRQGDKKYAVPAERTARTTQIELGSATLTALFAVLVLVFVLVLVLRGILLVVRVLLLVFVLLTRLIGLSLSRLLIAFCFVCHETPLSGASASAEGHT